MSTADKSIDPILLACAKEEFLQHGFDDASTNAICKKAGVTTGALYKRFSSKNELFWAVVNPALEKVKAWFASEQERFDAADLQEQIQALTGSNYHVQFLNLIYDNYDEFKILVDKSSQSQFAAFLDYFVESKTENTIRFINQINPKAFAENLISEQTIHILMTSYFNGQFEVIRHNEKREDALLYVEQMHRFYWHGWQSLMK